MQRSGAVSHCFPSVPDGHLKHKRHKKYDAHVTTRSRFLVILVLEYLHAEIVLEQVDTRSVVVTRFALARAYIDFASFSRPTVGTLARERVDAVETFAVVHARRRRAIVDVLFAHLSGVSSVAHTLVVVIQIQTLFCALGTTRVAETLVDSSFTLET